MKKHTPGPWNVMFQGSEGKENAKYWIMGGDGLTVVTIIQAGKSEPAKENARLVSAAPELLEACKEALAHFDKYTSGIVIDAKDSLRMAIAKTEGKK